ncbi:MAG: hypothetical protein V3S31_08330 [Dehalococcoidia bacterium]
MRLPSISRSQLTGSHLRSILRRPAALVDRGIEAASEVAGTIEQLSPAHRGRSRKQTAVTVAAVAVGAAAAGAAAYLWWRHRRDQEHARLFQPEPRQPDPVPASPPDETPDDAPQGPQPGPQVARDEGPVEAVAPPPPGERPEPVEPPAAQPVATHAPFGDLDAAAPSRPVAEPPRARVASMRRAIATPTPQLPAASPSRIPSWRIPLPLGRTAAPRGY